MRAHHCARVDPCLWRKTVTHIRVLIAFVFMSGGLLFSQQPSRTARLSLEEIESLAQQNNPEIRAAARRINLAQAGIPAAGALDDPVLMYRNWGTPLSRPYRWDEAQQMFMVQQSLPGPGKRALRSGIAGKEVQLAQTQLDIVRRE